MFALAYTDPRFYLAITSYNRWLCRIIIYVKCNTIKIEWSSKLSAPRIRALKIPPELRGFFNRKLDLRICFWLDRWDKATSKIPQSPWWVISKPNQNGTLKSSMSRPASAMNLNFTCCRRLLRCASSHYFTIVRAITSVTFTCLT